ncbi:MAG: hypothetical protein RIQ56_409 [Candidatus Parcubacteria bacterium]|jgi:hypothetical protein
MEKPVVLVALDMALILAFMEAVHPTPKLMYPIEKKRLRRERQKRGIQQRTTRPQRRVRSPRGI